MRLLPLVLLVGCGLFEREGDAPGECADGADQDADGRFDCDDPDCEGSSLCDRPEADTDTDSDTDTDTDTDSDTDTDTDTDTDADADTDTDTDTGPCSVEIERTVPASGATDAYYRAAIEFQLSEADPTATARSADISGSTRRSDDGRTVTFVPDDPLAPSTAYTVILDTCAGSTSLSFMTSELGAALADPESLTGRTYRADPSTARVTAPAGMGSVLTSYFTSDLLLEVSAADRTSLDLLAALTAEHGGAQDLGLETHTERGVDFTRSPYFEIRADSVDLALDGYPLALQDVTVTGTFAPDGSYIGGVTVEGLSDTRPLVPLVDDSGDDGAICDLAASFGAVCEACPSDGEPYCLPFRADQLNATADSAELVEVRGTDGSAACVTASAALPLGWVGLLLAARRQRRRG